jgi:exosortase/archaeosortase family protein
MLNQESKAPIKFIALFIVFFFSLYFFNIGFFSITSPTNKHYNAFLANHLNYIDWLRWVLLQSSTQVLKWLGYVAICNKYYLLVAGHGAIHLVYTCLGLGVMSFFAAFVLAYPKPLKARVIFLVTGIVCIQLLNIVRFVLLSLYWGKASSHSIDHHTIFNIFIYVVILLSLYFWINTGNRKPHAAN